MPHYERHQRYGNGKRNQYQRQGECHGGGREEAQTQSTLRRQQLEGRRAHDFSESEQTAESHGSLTNVTAATR
tara:strand:- start:412 stop:630 length:219 start_codon:yes stop_codon:yes gene_type:complete